MAKRDKSMKRLEKRLRKLETGAPAGAAAANTGTTGAGFFAGLSNLMPSRRSEQLLLGLALGAAGAWVLSDEKLRGNIMKSCMRLYAGLASGVEEMKEQVEDIKAELAAEQADPV